VASDCRGGFITENDDSGEEMSQAGIKSAVGICRIF